MFREIFPYSLIIDRNENISELSINAMTGSCNYLVLLSSYVPMKVDCRFSVSDDTAVLTSVGDKGATLRVTPTFVTKVRLCGFEKQSGHL